MPEAKKGKRLFPAEPGVAMLHVIRMRMHHNDPVHHVRVREQRNAAPVQCEQNQENRSCDAMFFQSFSSHIQMRELFPVAKVGLP